MQDAEADHDANLEVVDYETKRDLCAQGRLQRRERKFGRNAKCI